MNLYKACVKYVAIILFVCVSMLVFGQKNQVSTTKNLSTNTTSIRDKIEEIRNQSKFYQESDLDSSIFFARQALSISQQEKQIEDVGITSLDLGDKFIKI